MGASIHMHIEVKSHGIWYHYAAPHMFRNFIFFDLLGGIYGKHQPVVPPRGLPHDRTFVTQHDWTQDGESSRLHHAGWLSANELPELQARIKELCQGTGADPMSYDLECGILNTFVNGNSLSQHQGWDDLRLIFWFDN